MPHLCGRVYSPNRAATARSRRPQTVTAASVFSPPVLTAARPRINRANPQESWTVPSRIAPPCAVPTVTPSVREFPRHNPFAMSAGRVRGPLLRYQFRDTPAAAQVGAAPAARKLRRSTTVELNRISIFVAGVGRLGRGAFLRAGDADGTNEPTTRSRPPHRPPISRAGTMAQFMPAFWTCSAQRAAPPELFWAGRLISIGNVSSSRLALKNPRPGIR